MNSRDDGGLELSFDFVTDCAFDLETDLENRPLSVFEFDEPPAVDAYEEERKFEEEPPCDDGLTR